MRGFWSDFRAGVFVAALGLPSFVFVAFLLSEGGLPFSESYHTALCLGIAFALFLAFFRWGILFSPSPRMAIPLVYLCVVSRGLAWQDFCLALFCASALLAVLCFFPRAHAPAVCDLLPAGTRRAIFPALGLLLVCYGLELSGILQPAPQGLVQLGNFSDPASYFTVLGLVSGATLFAAGRGGVAIPVSMGVVAAISLLEGFWVFPSAPFLLPEISFSAGLAGSFDFSLREGALFWETVLFVFLLLWSEAEAVFHARFPSPASAPPRAHFFGFLAGGNLLAALLGSLPFCYAPENLAARECAGRGFALGVAAGFLFPLFAFPLMRAMLDFPAIWAAPLIAAGAFCLLSAEGVFAGAREDRSAAGMVLLLLPLTRDAFFSLGASALAFLLFVAIGGRGREIPRAQWGLGILFLLYFCFA